MTTPEDHWDLDSDHPWFDVEAVIRVKIRTEGWSRDQACDRNGDPKIELVSCTFIPQGYRTVDPTPIPGKEQ